ACTGQSALNRIVSVPPGPLIRVEGQPVSILCDVMEYGGPDEQDFEWVMTRVQNGPEIKIISTFDPGYSHSSLTKRVASGEISMNRLKDNEVELRISDVKSADSGFYICQTPSTDSEIKGNYEAKVQLIGKSGLPAAPVPVVSESGDILLSCNVTRELTQPTYFSVTWSIRKAKTLEAEEILSFGPQGEVTTGPKYTRRYTDGGVRLVPGRNGVFELVISKVTTSDDGTYGCTGTEWAHESRGKWLQIVESTKEMGPVTVTPISDFTLTLDPIATPKLTSEPMEVACHVTNITNLPAGGRLGVSWQHSALPGSDPQSSNLIGSLDASGNMLAGATYSDRLKSGAITLIRVLPNSFILRFLRTQEVDMGQYTCLVSAWTVNSQGGYVKTKYCFLSPGPILNVVAKRIREASVGGSTFEMSCAVSMENLREAGFSVLIQSQDSVGAAVKTIILLSPDNVVQHGGATDPNRKDQLVLLKSGAAEFQFRLGAVQLSDRGFYWCDITAFTKQQPGQTWTKAISAESNKVRIDFQENGPSFAIALRSDATTLGFWVYMMPKWCCLSHTFLISSPSDDLVYEVRWFFTRLRGGDGATLVASVDRFGVVKKEARNSSSDISIERTNTHSYELNVHGAQDSDSGEYHCEATPWYLSPSTGAWTEAGELSSSRLFLTVRFAVWDSLKLPLLYGAVASLGVGLFSLIFGLVCAHCCCRNTAHTPRSRNKLLDLEMD
uniref:Ig-like domain-containing protein n=1 Tax=Neogobius melanostomus TaxID=47308 RepID=A0A8C6V2F5_9GOBI